MFGCPWQRQPSYIPVDRRDTDHMSFKEVRPRRQQPSSTDQNASPKGPITPRTTDNSKRVPEQLPLHVLTWFIEPADAAVRESLAHIAKLIAETHPDVVCLQNLTKSMMGYLSTHPGINSSYYGLFLGLDEKEPEWNGNDVAEKDMEKFLDKRHVGILIRQPFTPENVQTFTLKGSNIDGLSCTIRLQDNMEFFSLHVATCVLDEENEVLRRKQWKDLLHHMRKHNTCLLAISTFSTDRSEESELVVPYQHGWYDAWYNANCPKQTEHTFDGSRNDLIPQPHLQYRFDRIIYRMPARVIKNGLMGKKPSIAVRYDDGSGAPNSAMVPPSTHFGWGMCCQMDMSAMEQMADGESDWNYASYRSVSEKNYLAVPQGGRESAIIGSSDAPYQARDFRKKNHHSSSSSRSDKPSRRSREEEGSGDNKKRRGDKTRRKHERDESSSESEDDEGRSDDEVMPGHGPNARRLKVAHREDGQLPEYLQGVKVDKKKYAMRAEELKKISSARAKDDLSRTVDVKPPVKDTRKLRDQTVVRGIVWKGADVAGNTREAYKGPSVESAQEKIERDRLAMIEKQERETRRALKESRLDPKKMTPDQLRQVIFGASASKDHDERDDEKMHSDGYKDLAKQRDAETSSFREIQRSGNY
jgi:hypothetical protein